MIPIGRSDQIGAEGHSWNIFGGSTTPQKVEKFKGKGLAHTFYSTHSFKTRCLPPTNPYARKGVMIGKMSAQMVILARCDQ